jgi:carbon monoxide dehydrogenase subunit G
MPEVEYTTTMRLSPEAIWDFIKDMNNWAPFLTGYQKHEIVDEKESVWTLKGDIGILSRMVKLKVLITEWNGPEKVSFTLTGLNEEVEGGGTFVMGRSEAKPAATVNAPSAPPPKKYGLFRRMTNAIFRFFFRLVNGKTPERPVLPAAKTDGPSSELKFTLRMEAGGPTGPLVNAMLGPALLPAAEDLANKIAAHLEKMHGGAAMATANSAA